MELEQDVSGRRYFAPVASLLLFVVCCLLLLENKQPLPKSGIFRRHTLGIASLKAASGS